MVQKRDVEKESVYALVVSFIKANRFPPTIKELVDLTGLSASTVRKKLLKLEDEGAIERKPRSARAINVVALTILEEGEVSYDS